MRFPGPRYCRREEQMAIAGEIRNSKINWMAASVATRSVGLICDVRANKSRCRGAIKSRANANLKLQPVRRHYRIVSLRITGCSFCLTCLTRDKNVIREQDTGTYGVVARGNGGTPPRTRSFLRSSPTTTRRLDAQRESDNVQGKKLLSTRHFRSVCVSVVSPRRFIKIRLKSAERFSNLLHISPLDFKIYPALPYVTKFIKLKLLCVFAYTFDGHLSAIASREIMTQAQLWINSREGDEENKKYWDKKFIESIIHSIKL